MEVHQLKQSTSWPLTARIRGVLRHPRATFEALAAAPRSADVLAIACAAACVATALVLETETGELALLDHLERTVAAFGTPFDEAQYAALQDMSGDGAAYAVVTSLASVPLLAVGLSATVFVWGQTLGKTPGLTPTYGQVLAVASHASVILALRQVIAAPLTYMRETMTSPLTLNLFLAAADEGSPMARFAAMIDVFTIWWIAVLAIGMSVLYRRPVARFATAFAGAYLLLATAAALIAAISGGVV